MGILFLCLPCFFVDNKDVCVYCFTIATDGKLDVIRGARDSQMPVSVAVVCLSCVRERTSFPY